MLGRSARAGSAGRPTNISREILMNVFISNRSLQTLRCRFGEMTRTLQSQSLKAKER
jgi:hypothetical protein